ncbi:MAG: ATP-binding protein [Patescibacteria group bacterium]|nr:ATP-binding protein [Patescibacteria group bacterium]
MTINQLKKIIIDQKEELEKSLKNENIIEREIDISKIKKYLSSPNILIIKGVRRCGKSTLAVSLLKNKKYGFLNFDDNALAGFKIDDFDILLQAFYELFGSDLEYFIFDEIQNIKGWELFAAKLRRTKKIVITGSNAYLLSRELSTHLTGRYISIMLMPFSFKEYLDYHHIKINKNDIYSSAKIAEINKHLNDYMYKGGLPEVYKFGTEMAMNIYDDILTKDILQRHNIRYKKALKEISNYLISLFGNEFSYNKLVKVFEIKNVHTIKNYIDYISDSYIINVLQRFSYKLKQQHIAPKKVYSIDLGIISELAFQFSPNRGNILENTVYLELMRRIHHKNEKKEIYYWQDAYHREVDFVVKKGVKIIQLIQVAYGLDNYNTKNRETKSLIKGSDSLKCNDLTIITRNDEGEEIKNGKKIKIIPLYKFLLDFS